jgi:hypothetical protein
MDVAAAILEGVSLSLLIQVLAEEEVYTKTIIMKNSSHHSKIGNINRCLTCSFSKNPVQVLERKISIIFSVFPRELQ